MIMDVFAGERWKPVEVEFVMREAVAPNGCVDCKNRAGSKRLSALSDQGAKAKMRMSPMKLSKLIRCGRTVSG